MQDVTILPMEAPSMIPVILFEEMLQDVIVFTNAAIVTMPNALFDILQCVMEV